MAVLARANRRWWSIPVVAALWAVAGCNDPLDSGTEARETAVKNVRAGAASARDDLDRILRDPTVAQQRPAEISERIRTEIGACCNQSDGQILDLTVDPARAVRAQMIFYGKGEAGGGLGFKQVSVRLCAALAGHPMSTTPSELVDAPCPTSTPKPRGDIGTVDETVKLSD